MVHSFLQPLPLDKGHVSHMGEASEGDEPMGAAVGSGAIGRARGGLTIHTQGVAAEKAGYGGNGSLGGDAADFAGQRMRVRGLEFVASLDALAGTAICCHGSGG